jgi:hypothetical protein
MTLWQIELKDAREMPYLTRSDIHFYCCGTKAGPSGMRLK